MTIKLLITGVGGPAAISFMKAVKHMGLEIHAADMDPHAAGLYLVPPERRLLVPAGSHPDFVNAVYEQCVARGIDVLVPTVDSELEGIAKAAAQFRRRGTKLLLASEETLALCLDKARLASACLGVTRVPKTAIYSTREAAHGFEFPLIVKPRRGSGSRGVRRVDDAAELERIAPNEDLILQEYLPGEEYSVDVLATQEGEVLAAVPRLRLKIDSGVAVTSRTVQDEELIRSATAVAKAIGLAYVANVQFRRDRDGRPALLEVNPRFPGTMPLTVAAGVNMPALSLLDLLGTPPPQGPIPFKELGMVRYLEEQFFATEEMEALERSRRPGAAPRVDSLVPQA